MSFAAWDENVLETGQQISVSMVIEEKFFSFTCAGSHSIDCTRAVVQHPTHTAGNGKYENFYPPENKQRCR